MLNFLYEIKKIFVFQKGVWFVALFVLLKILSMTMTQDEVNTTIEENKEQYFFYLRQVSGPLTEETETFLSSESKKIAFAKKSLEKIYTDYYYGIITETELSIKAGEFEAQIENENGFQLIYDQYLYVRDNPSNRYFAYTNGWNSILAHERLDMFEFFLLLLLVTPIFCHEYESKMDTILLSSKKGRVNLAVKKILLAGCIAALLSLLFVLLEYTFFQFKYGLPDSSYPIQSMEYFHSATKVASFLEMLTHVSICKIFGYICFSVIVMVVSVYTKKAILALFVSTTLILLPYLGFTVQSVKYLLPIPLGFMVGNGYFRGDEMVEIVDMIEPQTVFKAISNTEAVIISVILSGITLALIFLTIKKYVIFKFITRCFVSLKHGIPFLLFVLLVALSGCGHNESADMSQMSFNMLPNRFVVENQDCIFYLGAGGSLNVTAENKLSGQRQDAIKNPFSFLFDIGKSLYVYRNNLYYIRNEFGTTKVDPSLQKFSISEIDWATQEEKTIFEMDTQSNKDMFLGIVSTVNSDLRFYSSIEYFFLDDENIYLVGTGESTNNEVRRISRQTGEIKTIIDSKMIRQLAYDGKNVYYVDLKFQIIKYDVATEQATVIPNIVTRFMILSNDRLYFINPRDGNTVYAFDTTDFSLQKITEQPAYSFHCDEEYIYYANTDDNNYIYRTDLDGKNNQKIAEVISYNIVALQKELYVLSDSGAFIVDGETFAVSALEQ